MLIDGVLYEEFTEKLVFLEKISNIIEDAPLQGMMKNVITYFFAAQDMVLIEELGHVLLSRRP